MPSGWFIDGKRLKNQQSSNLNIGFSISVCHEEWQEPMSSGYMNSAELHLMTNVKVYVGKGGRLRVFDIRAVSPWVKGAIAHELKHLWDAHYSPKTDAMDGKPLYFNFEKWLRYFGEPGEISAHVDQIARYARDKKLTFTDGFNAIIRHKIGRKGKIALGKGEKFKGSMEKLVQNIYDKQLEAFNKRYPTNRIFGPVFPDESWFAEHGSSLFSNPHDG